MNTDKKVTSIEDLIRYNEGEIVRLPDFAEGQEFYARLRRPSMMALARNGKIPNALLRSANELFSKGGASFDSINDEMLSNMYSVMEVICDSSFVEPSWQDMKNAGIEITDEQILFVFNYSQMGVKKLDSFR